MIDKEDGPIILSGMLNATVYDLLQRCAMKASPPMQNSVDIELELTRSNFPKKAADQWCINKDSTVFLTLHNLAEVESAYLPKKRLPLKALPFLTLNWQIKAEAPCVCCGELCADEKKIDGNRWPMPELTPMTKSTQSLEDRIVERGGETWPLNASLKDVLYEELVLHFPLSPLHNACLDSLKAENVNNQATSTPNPFRNLKTLLDTSTEK